MTRRAVLSGAALLGVGAGLDRVVSGASASSGPPTGALPFHGSNQAGIATPPQAHLSFAAFDVTSPTRAGLRELLQRWTAAGEAITAGHPYGGDRAPSADPGEALGLPAAQLTLTFGFGPTLFRAGGRDRFGLGHAQPALLEPLPAFPGDALDAASSEGDLCVQACANDPQVTFHAIHLLTSLAGPDATLRWLQSGFQGASPGGAGTSRNLIGFKDGTNNIKGEDATAMKRFVWAQDPGWMRGGTYLIARRIQIVFAGWDPFTLEQQEQAIGRYKRSGAPLGARHEHDPVNLAATDVHGNPVIPIDAHVRVASPENNGGRRILRRGYSFSRGITAGAQDHGGHQVDGGLFFIAFARDPSRQLVPLLRKVSARDALATFTVHTASAVFACPPGVRRGGFIGEQLFA